MGDEAARALYEYQQGLDLEPSAWWTLEECAVAVELVRTHPAPATPWDLEMIKHLTQAVLLGCVGLAVMLAGLVTIGWAHNDAAVISFGFAIYVTLLSVVGLAFHLGRMRRVDLSGSLD